MFREKVIRVLHGFVTLPLFPRMEESDVDDVLRAVARLLRHFRR